MSDKEGFTRLADLPASNFIVLFTAIVGLVFIAVAAKKVYDSEQGMTKRAGITLILMSNGFMTLIMVAVELWSAWAIIIANIALPVMLAGMNRLGNRMNNIRVSDPMPWKKIGYDLGLFYVGLGILLISFIV